MHQLAHFGLGQNDVRPVVIADQESIAIAMALDLARQQMRARGHQQQAGAIAHDLPAALELVQCCFQRNGPVRIQIQLRDQFRRTQWGAGTCHYLEHGVRQTDRWRGGYGRFRGFVRRVLITCHLTSCRLDLECALRCRAQVAKLVDALDSGSSAARCGGSSPLLGTIATRYCAEHMRTVLIFQ